MLKGWFDFNSPQNVWLREHQRQMYTATAIAGTVYCVVGAIVITRAGRKASRYPYGSTFK